MSKKKTATKNTKAASTTKGKALSKGVTKRVAKGAGQTEPEADTRGRRRVTKAEAVSTPAPEVHNELPGATEMPSIALDPEQTHLGDAEAAEGMAGGKGAEIEGVTPWVGDPRLPQVPTTLVRRDRHGVAQCECSVGPDGIFYKGQRYRSLSGAASAASKDLGLNPVVNGYVFFQLAKPARNRLGEVERLERLGKRYEEHLGALLIGRSGELPDDAVRGEIAAHAERVARIFALCVS